MIKFSVIYNAIGMKEEIFSEKENADLFADALNTLKECECIPSEILKQRNELIELSETLFTQLKEVWEYNTDRLNEFKSNEFVNQYYKLLNKIH